MRISGESPPRPVGITETAVVILPAPRSRDTYGRDAAGQRERRLRSKRELETLIVFAGSRLPTFRADAAVAPGALVDVSIGSAEGTEERTVFVLPVGAGTELSGPGGDGFISVITPASPVGRAMQGLRAGDCFEVVIDGRDREWTVVDVC